MNSEVYNQKAFNGERPVFSSSGFAGLFPFRDTTMPNMDFRITTDALDHPKIVKLQRICGEHGVLCLFRLWAFTARYHPRGDLNNMTDEDIEIASKWNGKPGVFFAALIKYRMLDEMLGAYSVHDWQEHNAYAFHAPERSEKARNAARVRWESDEDTHGNASSNAHSNAPSPNPSPKPNPNPKPSPDIPGKPGVRIKVGPIEGILERERKQYPEIFAFIEELFPGKWGGKELKAQADALRLICHQDMIPKDAEKFKKSDEFYRNQSGLAFNCLRWAFADTGDRSWPGWSVQFKSFAALRRKRDGVTKFEKIWAAYQASLKKPKSRTAELDDREKFKGKSGRQEI